jgi:diadenosine tetraphosphatase ApaH/serine/threonine PP2A family protein phosphatase
VEAIRGRPGPALELGGRRALVNPGSVGQPRDGNPASSYLMVDTDANTAVFRRVAYDIGLTQRLMRDVELPARLIERLSWGR